MPAWPWELAQLDQQGLGAWAITRGIDSGASKGPCRVHHRAESAANQVYCPLHQLREEEPTCPPPIMTGPSRPRMAIPKEGYFELERGRYGPVFPRTPACYGFSIIAKVKEGREDAIREHGKTIRSSDHRYAGFPCATTTALPSLVTLRYWRWLDLRVPGHLRHRLRQIHRGRRGAVQPERHYDGVHQPQGLPGGLEGEPRLLREVRARSPLSQLFGNRRVPVCDLG